MNLARKKQGKREYLSNKQTGQLTKKLGILFESTIEVPRIKIGKWQTIATLINEEALLFAKYLRNENKNWNPRIAHAGILQVARSTHASLRF